MTWKATHLLAASFAGTFLVFLLWDLAAQGNFMLPAREHPEPMSAFSSLAIVVCFSLAFVSAVRALCKEGDA